MDVLRIQVFFCRTAHQVLYVPPEVLRNGRFGEIFFVARPGANVRAEIFRIHLDKRRIDWGAFSLIPLADASDGFSGAEIEQAVVGAMYVAHAEGTPLGEAERKRAEAGKRGSVRVDLGGRRLIKNNKTYLK